MKKINIESSQIKSIGYDIQKRLLEVEFTRGSTYNYKCVDYIDVLRLIFAESAGSYFNTHIAKNYEYEKVSE